MKYRHILFDLDGTLTDSQLGITRSVAYALQEYKGISVSPETLKPFVGPPFVESFKKYYDFSEAESKEAIAISRIYFKSKGMYENEVYPGVKPLLENLTSKGYKLYIATSKPTVFAEKILKHFDLDHYFKLIAGSNLDGTRTTKEEVIEYVIQTAGLKNKDDIVMIGDREHDIQGAKTHGLNSIGVLYGYGSHEELMQAGADYIVDNVESLEDIL